MKIGQAEVNVWVLGAVAVVIVAIIVWVAWPKTPPPSGTQTINEVKAALEKQYQDQIKDKDGQIQDYKNRLTLSEFRYKGLMDKYVDLERRKRDVKPPVNDADLRERATALGYPPLPPVK
jgi:hypothetical protein